MGDQPQPGPEEMPDLGSLPELNAKERQAMENLPDDLIDGIMAGKFWDSRLGCWIPQEERISAAEELGEE